MFCRKCGKQIPDDSEFCYKCGASVITAGDRTETIKKETVSLEKEKPKPPEEKHLQQDEPSEATHVVTPDKKDGSEEQVKESSPVCPICGSKLLNPNVTYCPYCSMKIIREKSTQPQTIFSQKCTGCGELVYSNQRSCHNCGVTNPQYNSRFDDSDSYAILRRNDSGKAESNSKSDDAAGQAAFQKALQQNLQENRAKDSNTPVLLVNVNVITKVICIAAIAIALFLEFIIAKNINVSTYDGVMNYNVVIVCSYVFYGIFFLGLVVRIICAFIIAGSRGELGGVGIFIVVGTIITIIAGAISQSWMAAFILFGLIAAVYIGNKIRDWM